MKVFSHPFVRLGIIIVGCFIIIGMAQSFFSDLQRNDIVAERKSTLAQEEKRNEALQEEMRVATSASFIEKQARDKLGLAKSGDTIVLMTTPRNVPPSDWNPGTEANLTTWQRWWKLFF